MTRDWYPGKAQLGQFHTAVGWFEVRLAFHSASGPFTILVFGDFLF